MQNALNYLSGRSGVGKEKGLKAKGGVIPKCPGRKMAPGGLAQSKTDNLRSDV